jgi:hypothetical protein
MLKVPFADFAGKSLNIGRELGAQRNLLCRERRQRSARTFSRHSDHGSTMLQRLSQ